MSEDDWLEKTPMPELVRELTDVIVMRYRISQSLAEQMVHDCFSPNQPLRQAAEHAESAAKLKRMRVFKQAANEAKQKIYYHLRAYRADDARFAGLLDSLRNLPAGGPELQSEQIVADILNSHASTRERLALQDEFYAQLFARIRKPSHIVDVGCGVHPLMFPLRAAWSQGIVQYVAVDSNSYDVACVEAFSNLPGDVNRKMTAFQWDISEGWGRVLDLAQRDQFDLALMMKVIPVVRRQHRELLPILCETPAVEWLLTGSRVSLTKHADIERRERRAMEEFVRLTGREVKDEFVVGEEFAWIVA